MSALQANWRLFYSFSIFENFRISLAPQALIMFFKNALAACAMRALSLDMNPTWRLAHSMRSSHMCVYRYVRAHTYVCVWMCVTGSRSRSLSLSVVWASIVLCCYSVRLTEMSAHTRNAFVTQFPTSVIMLPVTSPHHTTAQRSMLCSAQLTSHYALSLTLCC